MPKSFYYGPSAPFKKGNSILPIQADERLIKNDLLQLLMTAPNERVMRPGYGTALRLFPFEMMDDNGINYLRTSIIDAVAKYETRVILTNVTIDRKEDENRVIVKLTGRTVFGARLPFLVELNLPINGSTAEAR